MGVPLVSTNPVWARTWAKATSPRRYKKRDKLGAGWAYRHDFYGLCRCCHALCKICSAGVLIDTVPKEMRNKRGPALAVKGRKGQYGISKKRQQELNRLDPDLIITRADRKRMTSGKTRSRAWASGGFQFGGG